MMTEGNNRSVTIELVIGLIVAIVGVLLFVDVPIDWKLSLVVFLGVVAVANFISLLRWSPRLRARFAERRREGEISKHPDLINELLRLNTKIAQTLYEASTSHTSLVAEGSGAMMVLVAELGTKLQIEFQEKIEMAKADYGTIGRRISERRAGYRWKTSEFVESMRSVSAHLGFLNYLFPTMYRQAALWLKDEPFPDLAHKKWEDFRTEYNGVLRDWKTFTERFDQTIGYGTSTSAEFVKEIP